jgi:FkbM family methyltransferase
MDRTEGMLLEAELERVLSEDIAYTRVRERSTFDSTVNPFQNRLVLFGAGNLGRKVLRVLRGHGIEPLAFSDNSTGLWGKEIEGVLVLPPPDAAEQFGKNAAFVVTAFSPACDIVPIQRQLRDLGCGPVVPFIALLWKYAEECLPHVVVDLPHRVLLERDLVRKAFGLFQDDASRQEYVAQVRWRLWQDFDGLPRPSAYDQYFPDDLFTLSAGEVFVDGGAFDGDTIRSVLKRSSEFGKIVALEPDPLSFRRLQQCVSEIPAPLRERISLCEVAAGAAKTTLHFAADGSTGAKIVDQGETEVACDRLENILAGLSPTYIKLDVEGAEGDALLGAAEILRKGSALWAVCVYHKQNDLWQLPLALSASLPAEDYRFFLRRHGGEIFDTVCYAVPMNRLKCSAA